MTPNPLIPQFWLLGVDAARGDLTRRGFHKQERPHGSSTKSSLHVLNGMWLQANGLWLESERLTYHRGTETFFEANIAYFKPEPPNHLNHIEFQTGLNTIRTFFLEHERWIIEQQQSRNEIVTEEIPFSVRQNWSAWQNWIRLPRIHVQDNRIKFQ